MSRPELKVKNVQPSRLAHPWKGFFSSRIKTLNEQFNSLSMHHKKVIAILSGMLIALSCALAVADGFLSASSITLPQTITQPIKEDRIAAKTRNNSNISTMLIRVGSMISMDKDAHTAFEIAMDHKGSLMISTVDSTHDTNKSQWRSIQLEELQKLEEKYRFVPIYQTSTEISK